MMLVMMMMTMMLTQQVWPSKPFGAQLTVLDMSVSKNYLQKLPDAAFFSMNIFRLSLGYNRIHDINPGAFSSLQSTLKYLNLENNRLETIPWQALSNLTSLMHLYIGSNAIQDKGIGEPQGTADALLFVFSFHTQNHPLFPFSRPIVLFCHKIKPI